jgi:hypothetical protein
MTSTSALSAISAPHINTSSGLIEASHALIGDMAHSASDSASLPSPSASPAGLASPYSFPTLLSNLIQQTIQS